MLKKHRLLALIALPLLLISLVAYSAFNQQPEPDEAFQTLVFLRHAEKPEGGLGQLNCQGLNRALSLSEILPERYGAPDYIFAANPGRKVEEGPQDREYAYLRPLLTIAPTAIRYGLPVNIDFSANDVHDFVDEITEPAYRNSTVYTAWSRGYLSEVINELLDELKADDSLAIDRWHRDNFDSVFVLRLHWKKGVADVSLSADAQGLNDGESLCPS